MAMNPYDWQRHRPRVEVPRAEIAHLAEKLSRGKSAALLAGRGMGKSVLLRQLAAQLGGRDDLRVVLIPAPPSRLTVAAMIDELAEALDVESPRTLNLHRLFELYFSASGAPERLVVLYDEFDRYGRPAKSPLESAPGREYFNNLESMRRDFPEVGILAAGSLGVFVFRDVLGSSFLARADAVRIRPFGLEEAAAMARPFTQRGTALSEVTLEALILVSGGNPALLTYGLEALWPIAEPNERDVAKTYGRFREENREFLRDFELSFGDPSLSEAPHRIWDLIRREPGKISHEKLEAACGPGGTPLRLDFTDVLDLLQAAGLVRVRGSWSVDPVEVHPIPGILSLPATTSAAATLQIQLRRDLAVLLGQVHASGVDFFRPGTGQGKQLVPESVFSAYLALGFQLLGWQVEREAQHGAGRTDLKLRWNGGRDFAVVEVKIWGRIGYQDVHKQVTKYWSSHVQAGAVVMLTDSGLADWPERYRLKCLESGTTEVEADESESSAIRARLFWESTTPDGIVAGIDHFLLRIPR